ncbi:MAG: nucleotidyltransferase domain-containing protein [Nanoarchaeota archaeon]
MSEQEERFAYAISFMSYLAKNIDELKDVVETVILYGSVAKNQSTKDSDIDLFIDLKKESQNIRNKIILIRDNFYASKESIIFKLLGVENDISLKIGKLFEWPDLQRSILSEGIVLFGRVQLKQKPVGLEHKILFSWDSVGKNRTAFLNRLYGYTTKKTKYKGFLEKWSAQKIGKSSILIPIKYRQEMIDLIKEYKVSSKSVEVFC